MLLPSATDNGGGSTTTDSRTDSDGGMICSMIGRLVSCPGGFSGLPGEHANDRLGL